MRIGRIVTGLLGAMVIGGTAAAQAGGGLGQSLGVTSYPAQGQTPQMQQKDEGQCYAWSKQQTGIDPMAKPPPPPPSTALGPRRRAIQNEEEEQAQAQMSGKQKATFDKAFSACMTGRGYVTR
jgi:hypothetical protein